jgi:hypothetical protein
VADNQSYQTREDYLRAAQQKLAQAAICLAVAQEQDRAERVVTLARDVRTLVRAGAK